MEHDQKQVIGIWESFNETTNGLEVKGRLFVEGIDPAKSAHRHIKAGSISGLSISFKNALFQRMPDGKRLFKSMPITEISICKNPVHPQARITGVKSHPVNSETVPMENQELAQEAKAQTPANDAAQIDTKALNAVMSRLDKLEAKSNRPGAPAIMLGEATEQKAFTNYLRVGEARMEATEAKALAVANNANGGYLVPPEQGSEILKLLTEMSPLRQYANIQTVTGSEITFPTLLSGVNAFWTEEGADMTVSKPTFGQIKIANHELSSFYVANNKVLEDNAYDLEGEMNREGAPTTDELRTMGNALYKQVDDAGVQVKPEAFSALRKSLLDRLRSNTGYDELPGPGRLTPNTGRVMEIMQQADNTLSATPTAALPFKNLDQMRRQAGAAAGNVTNKTDQAAGMSVIGGLDDFVQRLGPDDVVAGDP